jgi:hypothetical protein
MSIFGSDLQNLLADLDPDFTVRRALLDNDLAIPRMLSGNFGRVITGALNFDLLKGVKPNTVNAAGLINRQPNEVSETLRAEKVNVVEREVASEAEIPSASLLTTPFINEGDRVIVYRAGDRVVGFGRYDVGEELASKDAELNQLRSEMSELRAAVAALQTTGKRGRSG